MIRIFYMSFIALFFAVAGNPTPAFAGSDSAYLTMDCHHSKLDNTSTKNTVAVEFYDGTELVSSKIEYQECHSTKDTLSSVYFKTATETKAVDNIKVKTKGTDALFIDEARMTISGTGKSFGQDNGKGWCLSTNKSDGAGKWKKYVDQSFGCHSCLKFVYSSGKVYSCD